MNLIVAVDNKWGIGKEGKLLFRLPPDMEYFRKMTTDSVVVMGKKTLQSFPNGNPLKNRINVLLTHDKNYVQENVIIFHSVEDVLNFVKKQSKNVFVIGGSSVYYQLSPYCNVAYITKVFADGNADCFFDGTKDWKLVNQSQTFEYQDLKYCFCTFENPTPKAY